MLACCPSRPIRSPTDERFRGRYLHPCLKSKKLPIGQRSPARPRRRARAATSRTTAADAPASSLSAQCASYQAHQLMRARRNTPALSISGMHNRSRAAREPPQDHRNVSAGTGATTHLSGGFRGLSAPFADGWIAQRVPLGVAADVALLVPAPASQEIRRSPALRAPSGSDAGLQCELPLPTASLLAPDRLLQARRRTFCDGPTLLARLDVGAVYVLKCDLGSVEWGHIMDVEFYRLCTASPRSGR